MAKRIHGETSLKVEGEYVTLRLTMGAMQDLEHLLDCSFYELPSLTLAQEKISMDIWIPVLAAMLGYAADSEKGQRKAISVIERADPLELLKALSECFSRTFNPAGVPKKTKEDDEEEEEEKSAPMPSNEFWGSLYDTAAMIGIKPAQLVDYTLPEYTHMVRGWKMRNGIDPDQARKSAPMSRKRMMKLFDDHDQKQPPKDTAERATANDTSRDFNGKSIDRKKLH